MKKYLARLKYYLPVFYILLIFLVVLLLLFLFCLIPMFYDWFKGNQILEQHVREVVGNKTDDAEIAGALMQWVHDNVVYPDVHNKTNILGLYFYKINEENRFFWRDAPASWTIIKKIGMCGEDANYFVGVMNYLGYKSRKIKPDGWDHAWAEYYTKEGTKIVLDPSSNQIIYDLHKWVEGKNVTKVEAINLKGKKEDISLEYLE